MVEEAARFASRVRKLEQVHRRHRPRRYTSLLAHWSSRWLRRPQKPLFRALPKVACNQVSVTFIGHASTLICYANCRVVIDPMLGHWVGGIHREVAPGLAATDLSAVDLVLITGVEPAYMHWKTLQALPRRATLIVPPGGASRVSRLGFARLVELAPGASFQEDRVWIRATRGSVPRTLGYAIHGKGPTLFACSQTGYCREFAEIGQWFSPDIAILPIGDTWPRSFRRRHMSALDALYAFEDLGARIMIPVHHGAFALSYERIEHPRRWLDELVARQDLGRFVVPLAAGESCVFTNPAHARWPTRAVM